MAGRRQAISQETREKAVKLRLSGNTLTDVADQTGLTAPTVAALTKAYEEGGWEAVHDRKRGRPEGGSKDAGHALEKLKEQFLSQRLPGKNFGPVFNAASLAQWLTDKTKTPTDERTAKRRLADWALIPPDTPNSAGHLYLQDKSVLTKTLPVVLWLRGPRSEIYVMACDLPLTDAAYLALIRAVNAHHPTGFSVRFNQNDFAGLRFTPQLAQYLANHPEIKFFADDETSTSAAAPKLQAHTQDKNQKNSSHKDSGSKMTSAIKNPQQLTHLQRLEAESIHIMREAVAQADNPVMLYSIGKDSTVMLRLALKAFFPGKLPFPLLHIDSTWEFREMYAFSQWIQKEHGVKLISHVNEEGLAQGINPFTHGSQIHTDVLRTQGLKQALDKYQFDLAFGGSRRDEEKSRAKERVFSFRTKDHRWDPKNQRPELWNLYNAKKNKGESIRVFPLSNWTELDIWQYIYLENVPIVSLYFAAPRPVVNRDGSLIMVDDDRMPLSQGEVPMIKNVRFRTLGCYPFTGAVESTAATLEGIIQEMLLTKTSERQGRVIDHDSAASMEKKKQAGYF